MTLTFLITWTKLCGMMRWMTCLHVPCGQKYQNTPDNAFVLPGDLPSLSKNDELLYKKHLTCFWHSSFKKVKLNTIQAVQAGRDVVIQPTGSGKSVCYQVPALFNTGRMVVCVCPTIALIHSQVTDLVNMGIDAVAFGRCVNSEIQSSYQSGVRPLQSYQFMEQLT